LFKFYNVQDGDNPNYLANVLVGDEDSYTAGITPAHIELSSSLFGGSYIPVDTDGVSNQWLHILAG
jgi:hypothetical protein